MERDEQPSPPLRIPNRIFAVDHEPVGVRVTPYHKPHAIRKILNALYPEEVNIIRGSPFGKLVEIIRGFVLSLQLKMVEAIPTLTEVVNGDG
ncbi:hypothetical protein Bca52824_069495 [Brassica carinata]|uniref:Uncharacterized protein n=1 Tax=Brassica carinata TaxID=52824 RepID=A0A8X7U457_BRACI|nr:hypothetical protein Bca52824_069495 [Brassica carinata]